MDLIGAGGYYPLTEIRSSIGNIVYLTANLVFISIQPNALIQMLFNRCRTQLITAVYNKRLARF